MDIFNDFKTAPKKYTTLLGSVFVMISLGAIGSLGNLTPYLISYQRIKCDEPNLRYSKSIFIHSTQIIFLSLSSIPAGLLKSRYGFKLKTLSIFGTVIVNAGLFLSYFSVKISYICLILTYGMVYGCGYGFVYIETISMNINWFPKFKGIASSFAFCGYGLGTFIYPQIQRIFINPKNYSPDESFSEEFPNEKYFTQEDMLEKVPETFLLMAATTAVLGALGLLMMYDKPADDSQRFNTPVVNTEETKSIKELLRDPLIYKLTILYECFFMAPAIFMSNYKNYGQEFIHDDSFLTFISSASGFMNIFSRFIWGFIIDKCSFKSTHIIINSMTMIFILTIGLNEVFKVKVVYLIWVLAVYFFEAGMSILLPTGFVRCYGQKNLILVFALVQSIAIPGFILQSLLSLMIDIIGYYQLFLITCSFSSTALITAVFFFKVKNEDGEDI